MDYHQNARLTIHSREQLAKMVVERGCTLKAAAAAFNVSAKTAAKWTRRYKEPGPAGLRDLSSRPHRSPRQTSSFLLERVLALRRLRWNGWRIAHELKLSRATVSRLLRRAGMNRLRSLDPPPSVIRYEHRRPGDLVHFDIKRLAHIRRPGHAITGNSRDHVRGAGDGAVVTFDGCVRNQSHGRRTLYLDYEAYESMALTKIREIASAVHEKFQIHRVAVAHSTPRICCRDLAFWPNR